MNEEMPVTIERELKKNKKALWSRYLLIFFSLVLFSFIASSTYIGWKVYSISQKERLDCFTQHVLDAISLNEKRKIVYSKLTKGQSEEISDTLIFYEKLTLIVAALFHDTTKFYQDRGLKILCEEFVEIVESELPPLPQSPEETGFDFDYSVSDLQNNLWSALEKEDYEEIHRISVNEMLLLSSQKYYFCMVRHLLESIARAAVLAPMHREQASALGLEDPSFISDRFIWLNIYALSTSLKLDRMSGVFQHRGIPILCAELPFIPYDPSEIQSL